MFNGGLNNDLIDEELILGVPATHDNRTATLNTIRFHFKLRHFANWLILVSKNYESMGPLKNKNIWKSM